MAKRKKRKSAHKRKGHRARKGHKKHKSCPIAKRATVGGMKVALYRKSVKNAKGGGRHSRVFARRIHPGGGC